MEIYSSDIFDDNL